MWITERNDKYVFTERYIEEMTGLKKTVSVTFDKNTTQTRKQANIILQQKIADKLAESDVKDVTVKELANAYNEFNRSENKLSTWRRNKTYADAACNYLGEDTLVSKLTARYINTKLLALNESSGTTNERVKRLKGMLRWAYRNDYIESIYFLEKLVRKKEGSHREKIQDKFLESDEARLLLSHLHHPVYSLLAEFMLLTGVRVGEAISLTEQDVNIKERTIRINKTYDLHNRIVTDPKTFDSNRILFMQDDLVVLCKKIKRLMKEQRLKYGYPYTDLFLCTTKGKIVNYFNFNIYLKKHTPVEINKEITTHVLRHTHASILAELGQPIEYISQRLGHFDSKTTKEIYLHVTKVQKMNYEKGFIAVKIV